MHRVPNQRFAEIIGEAYRRLPRGLAARLGHVQFLCGVDPAFSGLHFYTTEDGHPYSETAHCAWPFHIQSGDKVSTIVLPMIAAPAVVVHELGHALHETIGFQNHTVHPVSDYARTNKYEAFAEALVAYTHYTDYDEVDEQTQALFRELSKTGVLL